MTGNILIVDDELLIRKGLRKLIETNELGWQVVGEAGNGQEALAQLEELKPNLILCDIRMPVMDGIELARRIAERNCGTAVILLTGFRDFEYAQAAVRYGVKDFLLKPCPEEEICRVLRQAYEQLRARTEQRRAREEQALRSLLLRLPQSAGEPPQRLEWLHGADFWLVSVETFLPQGKQYRAEDVELLQFAIGNIAGELMSTRELGGRWLTVEYGRFAFFLKAGREDAAFFEHLVKTVDSLLGLPLKAWRLGAVKTEAEAEQLYKMHSVASPLLGSLESRDTRIDEEKIQALHAEITSLLLLGKHAEIGAMLRRSFEPRPEATLAERKTDAFCLAMVVREVQRKELEKEAEAADIGSDLEELVGLLSIQAVDAWIAARIGLLERMTGEWLEARKSGLVERSIRYMEQHYKEECSLAAVAAHVHLNPNYFSNLFKKQTGESFSGYLTRLRMEKARMLLTNTDMKITEIAEAVGYSDSNYFATAFKQAAGCSPSEYRKQPRA